MVGDGHGRKRAGRSRFRLAVVISHPIQYFSPWFRNIAATADLDLKVFYLWDFGVQLRLDRQFERTIQWDIPLLEGYDYTFVPNRSQDPGTHRFWGLDNPGLVSALADWRPDAILLFGYLSRSHFRVFFSSRLRQVPRLLRGDSHNLFRPPGLRSRFSRWARSKLFERFDAFLAVGKANTDYYRSCGVPESRIHFVPHCVDNDRFQTAASQAQYEEGGLRRELGIPPDARVVLFAGKFEDKKRPLDLLAAFRIVEESLQPKCAVKPVLLMVGSGALKGEARAMAGERAGQTVFFAPFQNQTRMPRVYAACDLFVLPSFGSDETWGLAVNEAMNLAKPVIVSTHVGCGPDLVQHGRTGWIFRAGDVTSLADVIVQALLMDGPRRAEVGMAARELVSRYSYAAATAGLMNALSTLRRPKAERGRQEI